MIYFGKPKPALDSNKLKIAAEVRVNSLEFLSTLQDYRGSIG
jgi:hypothetical protein